MSRTIPHRVEIFASNSRRHNAAGDDVDAHPRPQSNVGRRTAVGIPNGVHGAAESAALSGDRCRCGHIARARTGPQHRKQTYLRTHTASPRRWRFIFLCAIIADRHLQSAAAMRAAWEDLDAEYLLARRDIWFLRKLDRSIANANAKINSKPAHGSLSASAPNLPLAIEKNSELTAGRTPLSTSGAAAAAPHGLAASDAKSPEPPSASPVVAPLHLGAAAERERDPLHESSSNVVLVLNAFLMNIEQFIQAVASFDMHQPRPPPLTPPAGSAWAPSAMTPLPPRLTVTSGGVSGTSAGAAADAKMHPNVELSVLPGVEHGPRPRLSAAGSKPTPAADSRPAIEYQHPHHHSHRCDHHCRHFWRKFGLWLLSTFTSVRFCTAM